MKKVLLSKTCKSYKCTVPRRLDGVKPLVSCNWETRNNSSSVEAILHPDLQLEKPRKYLSNNLERSSSQKTGVYKKCCLSSNNCYCRKDPIRPTLFNKPNKCLSLEEYERKNSLKSLSKTSKTRSSLHCYCKGTQASATHVDLTDAETLSKYQEEIDEANGNLQITNQRRDYETYRIEEEDRCLREIEDYERNHEDIQTILGTICTNPNCHSSACLKEDLDQFEESESYGDVDANSAPCCPCSKGSIGTRKTTTIQHPEFSSATLVSRERNGSMTTESMRKFRDKNYFETHDIDEQLGKNIPNHVCVHQFKLDDRLLPQAESMDRYGKSRCILCNKPMSEQSQTTKKSYFNDKITREKISKFSKCLDLGLVPHDVTVGTSAMIKLKVKGEDIRKYGKFIGTYQPICYTNTFALRQQKMTNYYWRN